MKRCLIWCVLFVTILLTACSGDTVHLSEEEDGAITEYMAGTLLKYNKGYNEKLLYPLEEELQEDDVDEDEDSQENHHTESPQPEEPDEKQPTNNENTGKNVSLTNIYHESDFEISYQGYNLYEDYPDEFSTSFFTLETEEKEKLLVIEFSVKNLTKEEKKINLIQKGIRYQLEMNGSTTYKPMITLLMNDLQYLDISMKGKQKEKAVLVFGVKEDTKVNHLELKVSGGNKTAVVKMK